MEQNQIENLIDAWITELKKNLEKECNELFSKMQISHCNKVDEMVLELQTLIESIFVKTLERNADAIITSYARLRLTMTTKTNQKIRARLLEVYKAAIEEQSLYWHRAAGTVCFVEMLDATIEGFNKALFDRLSQIIFRRFEVVEYKRVISGQDEEARMLNQNFQVKLWGCILFVFCCFVWFFVDKQVAIAEYLSSFYAK